MTDDTGKILSIFDSLAALVPVLDDSKCTQETYDEALAIIPALVAADPFHPLARLLLRELARLEAEPGISPGLIPPFTVN